MWSNIVKNFQDDKMNLSGKDVLIKRGKLSQGDLRYWEKNPRIYSIVHASEEQLDQEEIQIELQSYDHVKQLYRDIKHHGGLIDPIVVVDNSLHVIEGNSRLAAIRLLSQKDPKFNNIRCIVLPRETDDVSIYSYLNQEHIQGKHEWSAYEQAGVIYRLVNEGLDFEELSAELGIGKRKARSMFEVYDFMVSRNQDNPVKYSYYAVYLGNRKAKKRREENPDLDAVIVEEVNSEQFTAQEFRKMLPHVCENQKQLKKLVSGKTSIPDAYEKLEMQGKTENLVQILKKIRSQLRSMDKDEFDILTAKAQKAAEYELKRITTLTSNLIKSVYGD